ncbi:chemotaxis response regulator protein-glutamate methylesterase [bacterium]|nr:chemotaxis response regulator protein-glutamate methylesterase [bacterium]
MDNMPKIRVLVVDDSTFIRKALKRMLNSDAMISVIGEAADGVEALKAVRRLKPDVITLDIKMPGLNGIQVIHELMKHDPIPILVISSLTSEGGGVTLQALEAGALDFIDKSTCHTMLDIADIAASLIQKVKAIAGVDIEKYQQVCQSFDKQVPTQTDKKTVTYKPVQLLVAIGASTGGPMSIERILTHIPGDFPGSIMIVQHMPVGFTLSFAERLDHTCALRVKEAQEDDLLRAGHVYIAPGGYHLKIQRQRNVYKVALSKNPVENPHRPSVDVLMESVASSWPGTILGVILTGMGKDGVNGIRAIKTRGGTIVAQDQESCVVFGMPKAAQLSGYVDHVLSIYEIADYIVDFGAKYSSNESDQSSHQTEKDQE